MLILAFESSAKAASVALMKDGSLMAESFCNNGKTHSATLMPMAESLLHEADLSPADLDCLAVAIGPGSFTGIRIGTSAVKGLAWALEKPVCPVSTLEAMAYMLKPASGIICPVMDARRNQVYNALFACDGMNIRRLTPDRAISAEELLAELLEYNEQIHLVGDGSRLCSRLLSDRLPNLIFPPAHLEQQHASGVAMAADVLSAEGLLQSHDRIVPNYLRLSQAERERQERLKQTKVSE